MVIEDPAPCMSPIPSSLSDVPDWPEANPDGSYTLTTEVGSKWSVWIANAIDYIASNYIRCGEN